MSQGTVYKCLECNKVFGTVFDADGISCPYCNGYIGPIGEVISRKQYREKNRMNIERNDNMVVLKETERVQPGAPTVPKKGLTLEIKVDTKGLDSAIEKVKQLKKLLGDIGTIKQESIVSICIDGMSNGVYVEDVVKAVSEQLEKAIGTKAGVITR